jgi:hypothetical protein
MASTDLPTDGEVYLGDGAYVRFDGWSLVLRAPRAHGDDIVVLGPLEWQTLRQFVNRHPGMVKHLESKP